MYDKFYPDLSQAAAKRFVIPWITILLVLSIIAVFLLQVGGQDLFGNDVVGEELTLTPQKFNGNDSWTVLTYAWIHSLKIFGRPDLWWAHIVFNLIPLVCLGVVLEQAIGHLSFLILYLGGAIAGGLAWLFWTPPEAGYGGLDGASGAVFAVIAGLAIAAPRARVVFLFAPFLPLQTSASTVAFFTVVGEVLSLPFRDQIAHSAHVGGAILCLVYVFIFHQLLGRPYLSN